MLKYFCVQNLVGDQVSAIDQDLGPPISCDSNTNYKTIKAVSGPTGSIFHTVPFVFMLFVKCFQFIYLYNFITFFVTGSIE